MSRKKKKREEPSGPAGAPEWVVTFTDMISLLVTFFVLLMTFSSLEEFDRLKVDAFFDSGLGAMNYKGHPPGAPRHYLPVATYSIRGRPERHTRPPEKLVENLEEMGQKKTPDRLELDFDRYADGLVIEFGPEGSFPPGSTEVAPDLEKSLREIGEVLENYPFLVVVEGFADSGFQPTPRHPTAEALSFARAESAAAVLLEGSDMLPELLQVAGLGSSTPRAEDNTPSGRELNRRVQLRVLSLSKALAQHYERESAGLGEAAR